MSDSEKPTPTVDVASLKPDTCAGCPMINEHCITRGFWDPHAKLTLLGETPSWVSIGAKVPFKGRNGMLVKKLLNSIGASYREELPNGIPFSSAYAAGPQEKPPQAVFNHCSKLWQSQWSTHYAQQTGKHVIVAFGLPAAKSAGVTSGKKILDIRGRVYDRTVGHRAVKVVPTLSLATLYAKPGMASVVQQDILRAVKLAYLEEFKPPKTIDELKTGYIFPRTIQEVRDLCDMIIGYTDPEKQPNPYDWPIAVDIETNTLKAFRKDAKVLMISFAWDDGKAAAIALNHQENTFYDPEEAWKEVTKILECPKPKVFHNSKYDVTFIEAVRSVKVNNIMWDTMCGQHWLSEDQKGVYGLKALAPMYAPEYEGYEETLHNALRQGEDIAPTEADVVSESRELTADSGEVIDDSWFEGESAPEEEEDLNAEWKSDPEWPTLCTEEQREAYRASRDAWFQADSANDAKGRTKAIKVWRKAAKELGLPKPEPLTTAEVAAEKDKGFEAVPLETLLAYAAADADVTRIIIKKQWRLLQVNDKMAEAKRVMAELYLPASRALGSLEYRGVKVNLDLAREYDTQLTLIMDDTQKRIYDLACREFKINASHQLSEVLGGMGFRTDQLTKKNQMKTSKEILNGYQKQLVKDLANMPDGDAKALTIRKLNFIEALLLYKASHKMKSSFLRNLRSYSQLDGHIHTTFHLTGTSTGRLSSSRLNLQNLPTYMCRVTRPNLENPEEPTEISKGLNVKAMLIPEDDTEVFWNLDIKAAEIRVTAFYSGDQALIQALNDGLDVHTFFLTKIKHPELQGDELRAQYAIYNGLIKAGDHELNVFRTAVKRVVFGTLYGAGAPKIAAQIGNNYPVDKAQGIIDGLFAAFPGIKDYISSTKNQVLAAGEVSTVFGRFRRFMLASLNDRVLRGQASREAVNFRIQSTSSDLVVSQLYEINDHLHEIDAVMRLTVHDSMAGTIKKSRVKDMKAFFDYWLVERVKERFPWLPVPFLYDLEIGESYGVKMSYKKWMETHGQET